MPKLPTNVDGKIFGKLTVIHCNLPPPNRVLVKCECGKEFSTPSYALIKGKTKSCGSTACSTRSLDLAGKTFGYLTAQYISENKEGLLYWFCLCICGKEHIVKFADLTNNLTKSCGCMSSLLMSKKRLKPDKETATNLILCQYKNNAKNRNLPFSLSREELEKLIYENCFYCGSGLLGIFTLESIFGNRFVKYNGIDRINSNLGYFLENCVPCCKLCNIAKMDLSVEEFLEWAKKLVKYQSQKSFSERELTKYGE